jgi:regulator of protease activity HflC (stomatin/prohibitin superfamily)
MKKALLAFAGVMVLATIISFYFFPAPYQAVEGILVSVMEAVLGIIIGLLIVFAVFVIFGLVSPVFADLLVNNPRAKPGKPRLPIEPGRIYFFTFMEDGQVKVVIKGSKFIRAMMADPERVFVGKEIDPDPRNADHWWIRPAKQNERSEPIPSFNKWNPLSWWIHWMHYNNGAVWVGIPFFRELRITKNKRFMEKVEDGKVVVGKNGLPELVEVEDWSDHLRTKSFFWFFKISSVDTKDNIKIGYTGYLLAECVNPYLASFSIDGWDKALTLAVSTWTNNFNRARLYDDLIASSDQTKNELADFLFGKINEMLNPNQGNKSGKRGIGINITAVNITDQEPQLTEKQAVAQTATWEAERNARATIVSAEADKVRRIKVSEGEARAIINKVNAAQTDKDLALALAEFEAWKEVKGQAFFNFGGRGTGNGALDAAILQKLTEISEKLNGGAS